MIDGRNIFYQTFRNNIKTYENIGKIATCVGNDYTTGYLLNYPYLKENQKLIPIVLSKQRARDADSEVLQPINFNGNLDQTENTIMFFILQTFHKEQSGYCESVPQIYFILVLYRYKVVQYNSANVKLSNFQLNKVR